MRKDAPESVRRHEPESKLSSDSRGESSAVLLVDDDVMVRGIVRKILELEGYHVLEAAGPGEALECCERHQGPIHLLLTDVRMPEMNGCQLARLVTAAREETKVLLMTGHADDAVLQYGIKTVGAACIRKPFPPSGLLNAIRAVLDVGVAAPTSRAGAV